MNGGPIAGAPIGWGGLGSPAAGFPGARAEKIRIDAALAIASAPPAARVGAEPAATAAPAVRARATRP